jgi:hypothetical protein
MVQSPTIVLLDAFELHWFEVHRMKLILDDHSIPYMLLFCLLHH